MSHAPLAFTDVGARSELEVVDQPWPVVYDALVQTLPTVGFRIGEVDPQRGRIVAQTRNTRVTIAVGAIDAITSEWIATAEQRIGIFPDRHERQFATIRESLDRYLRTYYAV